MAITKTWKASYSLKKIAHNKWAVFDGEKTAIVTLIDEGASALLGIERDSLMRRITYWRSKNDN